MPGSAASDLGLRCLAMSHKRDTRLIWVKIYFYSCMKKVFVLANSIDPDAAFHMGLYGNQNLLP